MVIVALGVAGFWVARHIYKHKSNAEQPLVCPINFDCHAVVHSDYSKFFGIPVEMLGMAYYAIISLSYLAYVFMGSIMPEYFLSFLAAMSLLAFVFSLYLISIQIFVLKKGCSWCIVSSAISALIFLCLLL